MKIIIPLLSLLVLYGCAQNEHNSTANDNEIKINIEECVSDTVNCINTFEYEVVALENNPKSIVSSVSKMVVTKKGYYILDSHEHPTLFLFGHDGKFVRKLDRQGHSKEEYINIFNFTANETGDTIAIMDNLGKVIKLYDDYGQFLSQHIFDEEYGWDDCSIIDGHFYMVSYHGGNKGIITKYNSMFSKKEIIGDEQMPLTPGAGVSGTKYIQYTSSKICYMDYFHSCFYLINRNSENESKKYTIISNNILNPEYTPGSFFDYDQILSYTLADDCLYFVMNYQGDPCSFRIDFKNDKLYKVKTLSNFLDYKDGVYYHSMSANNMKICIDNDSYFQKNEKRLKAFLPYKGKIAEQENLFIVKIQK